MTDLRQTFVSSNQDAFIWPGQVPLVAVPSPPPKNTGQRLYQTLARPEPEDCECDYHSYDSDMKRYKKLAREEKKLCGDMRKISEEMNGLVESMLESPCKSEEETMKSIYQIAYGKRDSPVGKYRGMMAAVDSPVGAPLIRPVVSDIKPGYRDPIRFRYSPVDIPAIEPPKPVDFTRVPEIYLAWSSPFQGRSEYMDGISKMGLSNMKNQQQYLEPLPSSRRRWGDCDL